MNMNDRLALRGSVRLVLTGPDGKVKGVWEDHNLVTSQGDAYFSSLARVGGAASAVNAMKLGTATTTPSKTGPGSYIGADYVSGSAKACDSGTPIVGASPNITQYHRTYAPGEATDSNINRVALVDNVTDAAEVDATHTWAIWVITNPTPPIVKGANDTLDVTWNITTLGA